MSSVSTIVYVITAPAWEMIIALLVYETTATDDVLKMHEKRIW